MRYYEIFMGYFNRNNLFECAAAYMSETAVQVLVYVIWSMFFAFQRALPCSCFLGLGRRSALEMPGCVSSPTYQGA